MRATKNKSLPPFLASQYFEWGHVVLAGILTEVENNQVKASIYLTVYASSKCEKSSPMIVNLDAGIFKTAKDATSWVKNNIKRYASASK